MKASTVESHHVFQRPLWDYAVTAYQNPELKSVSLGLQNKYHANINIILWCCWLKSEQLALSGSFLDQVLIKIDTVSQMTVSALRKVRRQLRDSGSFSESEIAKINSHIQSAELMIEKALLDKLQDLTLRFLEDNEFELVVNPAFLNVHYYLEFLQIPHCEQFASVLEKHAKN